VEVAMKTRCWLIPVAWAVGGGLLGYLAIGQVGVGASPFFQKVGEPYDPQKDFFALREARFQLLGAAGGVVGLAAGLALVRVRSRLAGAAIGGMAGAAIGFGSYWDFAANWTQPEIRLSNASTAAVMLAIFGLLVGFASVRQAADTAQASRPLKVKNDIANGERVSPILAYRRSELTFR
jgi:hypothetical protein